MENNWPKTQTTVQGPFKDAIRKTFPVSQDAFNSSDNFEITMLGNVKGRTTLKTESLTPANISFYCSYIEFGIQNC